MSEVLIKKGELKTAVNLSKEIPEFKNPHPLLEYLNRLNNQPHLILIAYLNKIPVGFKVAYERIDDGSLYSWMGGVLPKFRRVGIAQLLAEAQEKWAKENQYQSIRFKTRNSHRKMLLFALGNGFQIVDVKKIGEVGDYRIVLEKKL